MQNSAFEIGEVMTLKRVEYRLAQEIWRHFNLSQIDLEFSKWTTIKYLSVDGTQLNEQIESLPNDKGGLYLFSIQCPIIAGLTLYPAYIGRAQLSESQNLRKRCKEYWQKFSRDEERPKIFRLFKYWANEIFLSFLPIDGNDLIIQYEKQLINSLLLPFNDQIPDQAIRQAKKAFEI